MAGRDGDKRVDGDGKAPLSNPPTATNANSSNPASEKKDSATDETETQRGYNPFANRAGNKPQQAPTNNHTSTQQQQPGAQRPGTNQSTNGSNND